MSAAIYDSVLFANLFSTEEMRNVFSEESLVQKWLDVEAALARAEARLGIIPEEAAQEITKKADVKNMDLSRMGEEIQHTSHPIVPLIRQLASVCDKDYGQYVHWGATTQDIMDSANVLQIKEAIELIEDYIRSIQEELLRLVQEHRKTVLAGRTHGQHALPVTFGYKAAVWLEEMNRHAQRLSQIKDRLLIGQFSGAVGTLASIRKDGLKLQEYIMEELGLKLPNISWHASRDNFAEFASFLGLVTSTVGKIANEVVHLQKTEFGELEEPFKMGKVGSSTMPHKRNPSKTQNIVTVSRLLRHEIAAFYEAMIHQHERDMISWQMEWKLIPEVCLLASAALSSTITVLEGLVVNADRMLRNLELTNGLIISEAVMIQLGEFIGRQKAHDVVYEACMKAYEENIPLLDLLKQREDIMSHITEEQLEEIFQIEQYIGYSVEYADRVAEITQSLLKDKE